MPLCLHRIGNIIPDASATVAATTTKVRPTTRMTHIKRLPATPRQKIGHPPPAATSARSDHTTPEMVTLSQQGEGLHFNQTFSRWPLKMSVP